MEIENQIKHLNQIKANSDNGYLGLLASSMEFFRMYVGEQSRFYQELSEVKKLNSSYWSDEVISIIDSYIKYVESGLITGFSLERRVQIDTVSDFLEQAEILLNTKGVHCATACVLIGASLEEFLRTWIESEHISIVSKPSIDTYAKALREKDLITKQDYKDITSWGGLRNHAAHGEWEEVSDKKKIEIMLQGVNLFMRQYSK